MRRFVFFLLYGIFLITLVELGIGYAGYRLTQGAWPCYEKLKSERRTIVAEYVARGRLAANLEPEQVARQSGAPPIEILHPFLGYVNRLS